LPGRRDTPDHRDRPPASGGRRGATAGASKGSQVEWAIRRTGKVSGIAGPRIERLGELARTWREATGTRALPLPVPLATPALSDRTRLAQRPLGAAGERHVRRLAGAPLTRPARAFNAR
jgi:hypothetical protein